VGDDWLSSSLMNLSSVDWLEIEFPSQPRANSRAASPGIDLGKNVDPTRTEEGGGTNANANRRAMPDEIANRLSKSDLGPDGFFVTCHVLSRATMRLAFWIGGWRSLLSTEVMVAQLAAYLRPSRSGEI
jgi:hypothetical protein